MNNLWSTRVTADHDMHVLIVHGYGLQGSGSNQYTRELVQRFINQGLNVDVLCQERVDWPNYVREVRDYDAQGLRFDTHHLAPDGRVVVHRPFLPDGTLPVYNWDRYPGFPIAKTFPELTSEQLDEFFTSYEGTLRTIMNEREIAIVHVNHVLPLPEVVRRALEGSPVPYVVMPHGSAIVYTADRDPRYHKIAEDGLMGAAQIFVGGHEMRSRLSERWPPLEEQAQRAPEIPMGVDLTRFTPEARELPVMGGGGRSRSDRAKEMLDAPSTRKELMDWVRTCQTRYPANEAASDLATELARAEQDPMITFHGKLVTGKGIAGLSLAFAETTRTHRDARLWFLGDGPLRIPLELIFHALETSNFDLFNTIIEEGWGWEGKSHGPFQELAVYQDQETFSTLSKHCHRIKITERVHFGGFVSHATLARLVARAEVAVLPSIVPEAYPLVLGEMLAVGLAPLSTDLGGARPLLQELSDEFSVPYEALAISPQPESLVRQLTEALCARLNKRLVSRGTARAVAERRFSWESIASQTEQQYRRVLQATA